MKYVNWLKSINQGYFIKRFRQSMPSSETLKNIQRLVALEVQVTIPNRNNREKEMRIIRC